MLCIQSFFQRLIEKFQQKKMLSTKTLVAKLFQAPSMAFAINNVRCASKQADTLPPKADPDEYGHVPDPIEHAWGMERKMMIARLMGDDRYEQKVYYSSKDTTRDYPNLLPSHFNETEVICHCDPDDLHVITWVLRKDGKPHRCQCGLWFKAVDAEPDSF